MCKLVRCVSWPGLPCFAHQGAGLRLTLLPAHHTHFLPSPPPLALLICQKPAYLFKTNKILAKESTALIFSGSYRKTNSWEAILSGRLVLTSTLRIRCKSSLHNWILYCSYRIYPLPIYPPPIILFPPSPPPPQIFAFSFPILSYIVL